MRFFHLGDLHIGKQLHGFSLLEDQRLVLEQVVALARQHRPDAVLMAGDIYDRSIPPSEAVSLFDDFLTELAGLGIRVLLVSGNHDSPERLNFGSRLMRGNGVHLCGSFGGRLDRVVLADADGPVHVHLLPFVKPGMVRPFFKDLEIESYEDAVRAVVAAAKLDASARHVLVAHQFITNGGSQPERCDSETFAVGGVDNIDVSVFDGFDYVALGHIHGHQMVGRASVRYAGSPLKYSFSEVNHSKGVVMVELGPQGESATELLPLAPRRDLRVLRGPLEALMAAAHETAERSGEPCQDYIHAVLTDEADLFDPYGRLRTGYPNLMTIGFENSRTQAGPSRTAASGDVAEQSPLVLFDAFYQTQNGSMLSPEQIRILSEAFDTAGGLA